MSPALAHAFPNPSMSPHVPERVISKSLALLENFKHASHPPPPIVYPRPLRDQSHLPTALEPLTPQLDALDKTYAEKEHPRLDEIADQRGVDPGRIIDASDILSEYQDSRMGYVYCAGDRLQAVMGVRNERVFNIGEETRDDVEYAGLRWAFTGTSLSRPGHDDMRALAILEQPFRYRGNITRRQSKSGKKVNTLKYSAPYPREEISQAKFSPPRNRIEVLVRHNIATRIGREYGSIKNARPRNRGRAKDPTPKQVERHSGIGLRDFLLSHPHVRKRECEAITFSDFTPDVLSGDLSSRMIGHWTAERTQGEKIEAYELDLCKIRVNPKTGREEPVVETWLFTLLSRALLKLAPPPSLPPSFTQPIPTSWVVFACPLKHTTSFPEQIDSAKIRGGIKSVQKRQDYDFSHGGIPLFEFSSEKCVAPMLDIGSHVLERQIKFEDMRFLSVEGMKGYTGEYSDSELSGDEEDVADDWWRSFFNAAVKEHRAWEDIRSAMSRGTCRIVLRWTEYEIVKY